MMSHLQKKKVTMKFFPHNVVFFNNEHTTISYGATLSPQDMLLNVDYVSSQKEWSYSFSFGFSLIGISVL